MRISKRGWKYFTYVAEEVPRIVQSYLHISPKRENTFVGGTSMGGLGALKLALTYPERYAMACEHFRRDRPGFALGAGGAGAPRAYGTVQ